jgi:hypothetical protein
MYGLECNTVFLIFCSVLTRKLSVNTIAIIRENLHKRIPIIIGKNPLTLNNISRKWNSSLTCDIKGKEFKYLHAGTKRKLY